MINHDIRLPLEYRWFRLHGLSEIPPWIFIDNEKQISNLRNEFIIETDYPNDTKIKDFYPFAIKTDSNEVAGFIIHAKRIQNDVIVVNLTWSGKTEESGFPFYSNYKNFKTWMIESLIPDTFDFMNEETLSELTI